eukprot:Tamp_12174.p1 GENE.Tamp_12174~~Tamp_12174.p1  ORF type:complete len:603 (+),score=105.20 Tamp_12174:1-1809(+)
MASLAATRRRRRVAVICGVLACLPACASFLAAPFPSVVRSPAVCRPAAAAAFPLWRRRLGRCEPPPVGTGAVQLRAQGQAAGRELRTSGKRVVVVGGGFAGLGAAYHLSRQGYNVTLLDASPSPGGIIKDAKGNSIEAGVKGFWYQYANIFKLLSELGIKTEGADSALTDWSRSSFFSSNGREVDSVVFQEKLRLPTPLGQFVHTLPTFERLSIADRLSLWRLAFALVDYQSDYERYDSMSVADLMKSNGVSPQLYKDFLEPLLLAMLFAPPESLSAAVIIGTFDFLALGHQANFDVKWCRGPIGERILTPLVEAIEQEGGSVLGAHRMQGLHISGDSGKVTGVIAATPGGTTRMFECDAAIIAVGVNALQTLTRNVPALGAKEQFQRVMNLRASDCVAVRLTLDRRFATRSPANVMTVPAPGGGVIRDVGATFFNLNDVHDSLSAASMASVIEVDFYHAAALLPLPDDEITAVAMRALTNAEPSIASAQVAESTVLRAPKCATIFSPGSFRNRPAQRTDWRNLFLAGDFVRETPMHGADGLSQERALVTGLKAANLVVDSLGQGARADILDVEEDEVHIDAAKRANALLKSLPAPIVPLPF